MGPKAKEDHAFYFREWRQYRGLTEEQVAERINKSIATVSRLETGKTKYKQQHLEALSEAYNCEPEDLIARNPLNEVERELWLRLKRMHEADRIQALNVIRAISSDNKVA